MNHVRAQLLLLLLLTAAAARAQLPTGTIAGSVVDPNGAPVAGARLSVTNQATGLARELTTSETGDYSAAALPSGVYRLTAAAAGFRPLERTATVEAGTTTTVNFALQLGPLDESVTVEAAAPLMHYEEHQVGGVVSRKQIENLPLNGRGFLELAKLEPGVTAPTRGSDNRTFIPVLGAPTSNNNGARTRVTVDGGSVMQLFNGGAAMNFSQEVVEEFQLTSVNFDLAAGMTAAGAINVVTRAGGRDLHGGGFYFYRDHNLAAYPALQRDPTNPDPFFQRRQFGFHAGGPLRRDRLFFFVNAERNDQRGVVSAQPRTPEFVQFGQIAPSPLRGTLLSARLDLRATRNHYLYARYSHDGTRAFTPTTLSGPAGGPTLPSAWTEQSAWADQSLVALISTLRPTLVNELRFSYFFISSREQAARPADCPAGCIGVGGPEIRIPDANIVIGRSLTAENLGRRYHLADTLTWQRRAHRLRLGLEYEYNRGGRVSNADEPVSLVLFSPAEVRRYNALPGTPPPLRIPLPAAFNTVADILRLPVRSFSVGVGSAVPYQRDGARARTGQVWHLYGHDTWRLHPRLTLDYGLGWFYDPYLNRDLSKPAYLAPLFGRDALAPVRADKNNFAPALGFAWAATADGRTVVRGGGGVYYDMLSLLPLDPERVSLGPRGTGRSSYPGTRVPNPLADIPGVPVGTPLNFTSPTLFTGAQLLAILTPVRADLLRQRGDPASRDLSVRNIEADKLGAVSADDLTTPYAVHLNLGLQRQLARNLVVTADLVYRHFRHIPVSADFNHFLSARGPLLPACVGAQRDDPRAVCSAGAINVLTGSGQARYTGLLVRVEKRFSRRTQFLAAYAYSRNVGFGVSGNGTVLNNDDWREGDGPLDRDVPHVLNLSAVVELPWRFQLGFNSSYYSRAPFTASVAGLDFNGDGTDGDALPGAGVNRFNRGLGKEDLRRLVEAFNRDFAGRRTPRNQLIPTLTLPSSYEFGDDYQTQDVRLSRTFVYRERWKLTLIGEAFNLFNVANLSGYSGNLANPATFGQPARRFDQVFGSGGPRAFQFGARLSF
ncbi:MAG TPA: TonB-dependent receptor [Pyrinomonadaceae bacterium]|jgi:hypothetical protein